MNKPKRQYTEVEIRELTEKGLCKLISFGMSKDNVAVVGNQMYHRCTIDKDNAYHWLSEINVRTEVKR